MHKQALKDLQVVFAETMEDSQFTDVIEDAWNVDNLQSAIIDGDIKYKSALARAKRKSWSGIQEENKQYVTKSTLQNKMDHLVENGDLVFSHLDYRQFLKNDTIERDKLYQKKREEEAKRLTDERQKMMSMMLDKGINSSASMALTNQLEMRPESKFEEDLTKHK